MGCTVISDLVVHRTLFCAWPLASRLPWVLQQLLLDLLLLVGHLLHCHWLWLLLLLLLLFAWHPSCHCMEDTQHMMFGSMHGSMHDMLIARTQQVHS